MQAARFKSNHWLNVHVFVCESSLLSRTQPHVPASSNVYFPSPASDGAEKAFVLAANTRSDVTTKYPWPAIARQAVSGYCGSSSLNARQKCMVITWPRLPGLNIRDCSKTQHRRNCVPRHRQRAQIGCTKGANWLWISQKCFTYRLVQYLKSCSEDNILQNLILRTRLCCTGFITPPSCVFDFSLTDIFIRKWFVLAVYQVWKGISEGPAIFYMNRRGGRTDVGQMEVKTPTRLSNKTITAWSCAEDQILENKISRTGFQIFSTISKILFVNLFTFQIGLWQNPIFPASKHIFSPDFAIAHSFS